MRIAVVIDESEDSLATVKGAIAHIDAIGLGATSSIEAAVIVVIPKGEDVEKDVALDGANPTDATRMICPALSLLESAGIQGSAVTLHGKPAKEIVRYANDKDVDLVVIGSYYRRRFRKSIGSGQIGRKVSQRTRCPVLFIMDSTDVAFDGPSQGGTARANTSFSLQAPMRVAVAIDGSQESVEAVRHVIRMVGHREGSTVSLITVIPVLLYADVDFDPMAEYGDMQRQVIKSGLDLLDEAGITSELVMLHGRPADEIARYANSVNIDLLVVGSRALTDMYAMAVGGSVSNRLTAQVRCPLLIVKRNG